MSFSSIDSGAGGREAVELLDQNSRERDSMSRTAFLGEHVRVSNADSSTLGSVEFPLMHRVSL
jgi:hypothetical protein